MVGKYAPRGAYLITVTNASGTRTISRGVFEKTPPNTPKGPQK